MKILVIPDIHGRNFWIGPCHNWQGSIIFLGDYHDPYPDEMSKEQSLENLKKLTEFVIKNRDRCQCLVGNHDAFYLNINCPCSRSDYRNRDEVKSLVELLQPTYVAYRNNCLFTHSGLLPKWMNYWRIDLNATGKNSLAWRDVSPYRGGITKSGVGSILFGDVREYDFEEHLPEYYQIFGHTQLEKDPIIKGDYACLDCRKCFVVDTITNEIKEYAKKD